MQVDKITQSEIRCGSTMDAIYKEVRASKETNKFDKYEYLQKQDENPECGKRAMKNRNRQCSNTEITKELASAYYT